MIRKIIKYIMLSSAVIVLTGGAAQSDDWQGIPLVKDLMITLAARERMHDEFLRLQSNARLSPLEQSDFRAYINHLDLRIAIQCREVLVRYPDIDPDQLPCIPLYLADSLPDPTAEQTPDETLEGLDASLADGLAEFDEMLLSEQKKLAARPPRSGTAAGYAGAAQGDRTGRLGDLAQGGAEGADGQGGTERVSSGSEEDDGQPHPYGSGVGAGAGRRGSPPEDTPDGSKDDVVARQLREAAEQETDPELKRKLWDEYRRYKASTH